MMKQQSEVGNNVELYACRYLYRANLEYIEYRVACRRSMAS